MNMDKIHVRKILLSVLIFVTGMFSVSLANVFGGYFGAVAAIQVVAATVYLTYSLGDKQLNKTNLTDFVLVGLVLLFGVLFFVVNDFYANNHIFFNQLF